VKDLGETTKTLSDGSMLEVMRTRYDWDIGLTLRDWQGVGRVANIDVSNLATAGESTYTGANLANLLIKMYNKVQRSFSKGSPVIYCNETVKTALDLIASNKSNMLFTVSDSIDGNQVTKFRGIPIRVCDAILDTEARVV
jgi:hypothetical protein